MIEKTSIMMLHPDKNPSRGQSRPIFITAANGKNYYLKKQFIIDKGNKLLENCVFLQELLSYQLANYLGIPTPNCAIVSVDNNFLEYNRDLQFKASLTAGLYFATEVIPNIYTNILNNKILGSQLGQPRMKDPLYKVYAKVNDPSLFVNVIALDMLILNFDRFGNEGNFLITKNNNVFSGVAIDFGHSFCGPSWTNEKIEILDFPKTIITQDALEYYLNFLCNVFLNNKGLPFSKLGPTFDAMEKQIIFKDSSDNLINPFNSIVEKIENLNSIDIKKMFDFIPSDWYVNMDIQKNKYLDFIMSQKEFLRYLIDYFYQYGAFSNSIGGKLQWRKNATLFGTL